MTLTRRATIKALTRRWLAWEYFNASADRMGAFPGYSAEAWSAKNCLDYYTRYGTRMRYLAPIRLGGYQLTLLWMERVNGAAL